MPIIAWSQKGGGGERERERERERIGLGFNQSILHLSTYIHIKIIW